MNCYDIMSKYKTRVFELKGNQHKREKEEHEENFGGFFINLINQMVFNNLYKEKQCKTNSKLTLIPSFKIDYSNSYFVHIYNVLAGLMKSE